VFLLLVLIVAPAIPDPDATRVAPAQVGEVLLGPGLVAFELAGVLLLAALLAVLVIVKGGGER
jgi:NADH:ubiquinone oxidoreductase subunit 6 (subunit J)